MKLRQLLNKIFRLNVSLTEEKVISRVHFCLFCVRNGMNRPLFVLFLDEKVSSLLQKQQPFIQQMNLELQMFQNFLSILFLLFKWKKTKQSLWKWSTKGVKTPRDKYFQLHFDVEQTIRKGKRSIERVHQEVDPQTTLNFTAMRLSRYPEPSFQIFWKANQTTSRALQRWMKRNKLLLSPLEMNLSFMTFSLSIDEVESATRCNEV
jgi:hypothetical protein